MRPSQNPFRSCAIAKQRYTILPKQFSRLLQQVKSHGYRAAIVGPHGTGKSTLLEDIAKAMRRSGLTVNWYYLNQEMTNTQKQETLKKILATKAPVISCLDGGETIGYLRWAIFCWRVRQKQIRILATTHAPSPLTTAYKTCTNKKTALEVTQHLAGDYWCADMHAVASKAFEQNRGNCREVFRACYHFCSNLDAPACTSTPLP